MDEEPRFDIVYGSGTDITLEHHFCREWTVDVNGKSEGCYGTNPDHGYSFEEAKKHIIEHYERMVEYWKNLTLEKWNNCNEV